MEPQSSLDQMRNLHRCNYSLFVISRCCVGDETYEVQYFCVLLSVAVCERSNENDAKEFSLFYETRNMFYGTCICPMRCILYA